jgi:hypothetical protein
MKRIANLKKKLKKPNLKIFKFKKSFLAILVLSVFWYQKRIQTNSKKIDIENSKNLNKYRNLILKDFQNQGFLRFGGSKLNFSIQNM